MKPIPVPDIPVTDGEVSLRIFSLNDVAAVTAACQDPEIHRWTATIPWPYEESHARDWIASHEELREKGHTADFAIARKDDDAHLGALSFNQIDWTQNAAFVGYWVVASERGHRVATRALLLGAHWAFRELGIGELKLVTLHGNIASEKVAQNAGFGLTGPVTDHRIPGASDRTFAVKQWRLIAN